MMKPKCLFCYHKCGTVLLKNVFEELCRRNSWIFTVRMGEQEHIPKGADFTLFGHSPLGILKQSKRFSGIHIIRDPRDIVISGYLYHLRTTEAWCIHKDFDLSPTIDFPNVPFSQRHRSESWKKEYIKSLEGFSYQEKLKSLSQEEGIAFEMEHYAKWTIESMMDWDYENDAILEIRFEDVMSEYESTFNRLFRFLGLTGKQLDVAIEIARHHNIHNKTDKELSVLGHVHSRQTTRWERYFSSAHKRLFQELFGDCLVQLGYETSNKWA